MIAPLLPPFPEVADDHRVSAVLAPRYDDVTQDGRFRVTRLPMVFGPTAWTKLMSDAAIQGVLQGEGIVPILTRLILEGGDGPISVFEPVRADAGFEVAHALTTDGAVDRLFLNMWATVTGRRGSTYPPFPAGAGDSIVLGRAFCENSFTKLFAPPGKRRVTSLAALGLPERPGSRWIVEPAEALFQLPRGAVDIDDEPIAGPPFAFGVDDTDSNQHVNSLVYPERFVAEIARRLVERGQPTPGVARFVDIRFRKPCFAGDSRVPVTRLFHVNGAVGAYGALLGEDGRPHCTIRVLFRER